MATLTSTLSSPWNLSSIRNALPSTHSVQLRPNSSCNISLRLSGSSARTAAPKCFTSPFLGVDSFMSSVSFKSARTTIGRITRPLKIYAMRHGKRIARLNRPPDQRKALIRGLVTELLRHGRIKTTFARAKAIRKFAERMITLAKDGSLHKRRQALGFVYDKMLVHSMFLQAKDRYGEREGGYTRVFRAQNRRGDNAPMAYIELV
ncbi:hypothetical protein LUZ60_011331 [Juncus effusus]|nr:hypothetical protein LUZ60_011331 [Juncus effusus]